MRDLYKYCTTQVCMIYTDLYIRGGEVRYTIIQDCHFVNNYQISFWWKYVLLSFEKQALFKVNAVLQENSLLCGDLLWTLSQSVPHKCVKKKSLMEPERKHFKKRSSFFAGQKRRGAALQGDSLLWSSHRTQTWGLVQWPLLHTRYIHLFNRYCEMKCLILKFQFGLLCLDFVFF